MYRFSCFLQSLVKNYDKDMDTLTKQQKQQVERAEGSQSLDLKNAAKRIKVEQVHFLIFLSDMKKKCYCDNAQQQRCKWGA